MKWAVRAGWLLLPLWAAAGCVQDFSAFRFEQKHQERDAQPSTQRPEAGPPETDAAPSGAGGSPSPADSGEPSAPADTGAVSPAPQDSAVASDASSPPAARDAESQPRDAQTEPPITTMDAAGMGIDAGAPEDAGDDAGTGLELQMCTVALDTLASGAISCRECACDFCAPQILDCLVRGTASERQLCSDVLRCSLQNHCQDYACYCSTPGCNTPEPIGNGPCAAMVNAAAGGTRSRVAALRNADPPDPSEPLIRAGLAIACIYGVHSSSPGPTVMGMCSMTCNE